MKTIPYFIMILLAGAMLTLSCKHKKVPEPVNVVKWQQIGLWYQSEDNYWNPMPGGNGVDYSKCPDSAMFFEGNDWPDRKFIQIRIQDSLFKVGHIVMGHGYSDYCYDSGTYAIYTQTVSNVLTKFYTRPGSGWVEIEWISEDKRKFKGHFEMTLYSEQGRTVTLTNGYFNIDLDRLH